MKIGVLDYGIGGIGLVNQLKEKSNYDIVYLSDTGYTPYGQVDEAELRERIKNVITYFHSLGIEHIAVACNAASTVLESSNQILGILEFGIQLVLNEMPETIYVLGGNRTIDSNIYKNAFTSKGIHCFQHKAQKLSIRIEAGDLNSNEMTEDLISIVGEFPESSHILLACTHYPLVGEQIKTICKPSKLFDPCDLFADYILENWQSNLKETSIQWQTTGPIEQMKLAIQNAYQMPIKSIEHIPL
jgi:glutamate racemase